MLWICWPALYIPHSDTEYWHPCSVLFLQSSDQLEAFAQCEGNIYYLEFVFCIKKQGKILEINPISKPVVVHTLILALGKGGRG